MKKKKSYLIESFGETPTLKLGSFEEELYGKTTEKPPAVRFCVKCKTALPKDRHQKCYDCRPYLDDSEFLYC